jgi:hypothetical protein
VRADLGFGTDAFSHGEGLLEQPVQNALHGVLLSGQRPSLFDLTEYLRFAHDQRIQAGSDPE